METDPAVRVPEGELDVGVVGAQLGSRGVLEVVLGPEPHSGDRMSTTRDKIALLSNIIGNNFFHPSCNLGTTFYWCPVIRT